MEPILSNIADKSSRPNEPRDLLSRLYREIGISAVAAALQISGDALEKRPSATEKRKLLARKAA